MRKEILIPPVSFTKQSLDTVAVDRSLYTSANNKRNPYKLVGIDFTRYTLQAPTSQWISSAHDADHGEGAKLKP